MLTAAQASQHGQGLFQHGLARAQQVLVEGVRQGGEGLLQPVRQLDRRRQQQPPGNGVHQQRLRIRHRHALFAAQRRERHRELFAAMVADELTQQLGLLEPEERRVQHVPRRQAGCVSPATRAR